MKKKAITIVAATLGVFLASAPIVWAHQQAKAREMSPLMVLEKVRQLRGELNLTDAQVNQLRKIAKDTREANSAYRVSLRENFAEAGLALLDDPDNIAAAESILDRNAGAKKELRANVLEGVSEAVKVLTPEQRQKLETVIEHRASMF